MKGFHPVFDIADAYSFLFAGCIKTNTVIGYCEQDGFIILGKADADLCCTGMFQDIIELFLDYPEQCKL